MTDREILEKAIQRATSNGWKYNGLFSRLDAPEILDLDMQEEQWGSIEEGQGIFNVIFSHDFAKALWGEEDYDALQGQVYDSPKWMVMLQNMVISDNPIQYLGKSLGYNKTTT